MEAHEPCALIFGAETIFHHPVPDLARSAVLGDLLEEIVMRVEEEAEAWAELFDTVIQRECQFLQRGRSGLADVVSADRNRVEAGSKFRAELEGVDHQPHR